MLKLKIIYPYDSSTIKTWASVRNEMIIWINSNSGVFTASGGDSDLVIKSASAEITCLDLGGSVDGVTGGWVLALDDEKEFLTELPGNFLNTLGPPYTSYEDTQTIITNVGRTYAQEYFTPFLFAKDYFGEIISYKLGSGNIGITGGISAILDVGQAASGQYRTSGDYILRQCGARGHMIPELFYCYSRLGNTGDIVEANGVEYVCISGPIFYKNS